MTFLVCLIACLIASSYVNQSDCHDMCMALSVCLYCLSVLRVPQEDCGTSTVLRLRTPFLLAYSGSVRDKGDLNMTRTRSGRASANEVELVSTWP